MSGLEIILEADKSVFRPSERIEGRARWTLQRPPSALELLLFWRTEGKGTQDVGIAESARFENPGSVGTQQFSIAAPNGPYSFSGKLISILWALELVTEKGGESVRKDIFISPTGEEVVCAESIMDTDKSGRPGGLLRMLVSRLEKYAGAQAGSVNETVR